MKHLCILYISGILLVAGTSSCDHRQTDFYPNGTIRSEITLRDGHYHGPARFFYDNGNLLMECNYVYDTLHGMAIRYYENGKQKEIMFYDRNRPDSIYQLWNPQGILLMECSYRDSLLHGAYSDYYDNGQLRSKGQYDQGVVEGPWLFYNQSGFIIGKGDFSNGTGLRKAFYPDGKEKEVTRFENGVPVEQDIFDPEGNLVERKTLQKGSSSGTKIY